MASSLYSLAESASKSLAPSKEEMEAVLGNLYALGKEQNRDPLYLTQLQGANTLLQASPDVPTFLSRLPRAQVSATGDFGLGDNQRALDRETGTRGDVPAVQRQPETEGPREAIEKGF